MCEQLCHKRAIRIVPMCTFTGLFDTWSKCFRAGVSNGNVVARFGAQFREDRFFCLT